MPPAVIQRIADALEPDVRRAYLAAVERLQRVIDLGRLGAAIESGDVAAVNAALTTGRVATELRDVADLLRRLTLESMRVESVRLGGLRLSTAFRVRNPLAVRAAEAQAARLVTRVSAETRAAIRAAIVSGVGAGESRSAVVARVRAVIGLTERQARALARFAASGASAASVERYRRRLLRQRAQTIARTETMAAANAGQQQAWRAAQDAGLLSGDAQRRWIVTPDDRLCPLCQSVGGQVTGINEPFRTPVGDVMNPPLHPNCRCTSVLDAGSLRAAAA